MLPDHGLVWYYPTMRPACFIASPRGYRVVERVIKPIKYNAQGMVPQLRLPTDLPVVCHTIAATNLPFPRVRTRQLS